MSRPLMIDLFAGLGGWAEGGLAEGYDVVGFDIERHRYGDHQYPAQLVVQDVTTLHGSQFKTAALIVASPPCQEYSYMAMPWKLAKAKAAAIRADTTGKALADLNRLFDACFRIQKEASIAAGRHIPMVVENVRGAIPWVGRSRWNYGSFYLWGDVPALMPVTQRAVKVGGFSWSDHGKPGYVPQAFNGTAAERLGDGIKAGDAGWRERGPGRQLQDRAIKNNGGSWFNIGSPGQKMTNQNPVHELAGMKVPGFRFDGSGKSFQSASVAHVKVPSEVWRRTDPGKGARFTSRDCGIEGTKNGNDWFGSGEDCSAQRRHGSKSSGRKMASAMIAKIPLPLSRHIAATFGEAR